MKLEVPFNYSVYVGWQRTSDGNETYAGTASVEIPSFGSEDVVPVFFVGSEEAFGHANDAHRPVLKGPDGFLVPVTKRRWNDEEDAPAYRWTVEDFDTPENAFAALSRLLADQHDLLESLASSGSPLGKTTFSTEAKPRRGKPSIDRVRYRGEEEGHPLDVATRAVETYLRETLRVVDGEIHYRVHEPYYVVVPDKKASKATLVAERNVASSPDLYRLDEVEEAVARLRKSGREIPDFSAPTVLRPDLLERTFGRDRATNTFAVLVRHVAANGHRLSAGDLETFLRYRDVPVRGVDPDEEAHVLRTRLSGIESLAWIVDRYGLEKSLPACMSLADARHAADTCQNDAIPDLVDDDMEAIFGGPALG